MPSIANVEVPLISRSPTKLHARAPWMFSNSEPLFKNDCTLPGSCWMIVHFYCLLVHAPTPWTQTRKPRTVTTLATGRWTNDQDNSYHGTQKKKKEKEEVKTKRPLPLFDWLVKWNVQFLNVAPWPSDEPCFCPGPPTSASFEASTVFISVETASTMAVSHSHLVLFLEGVVELQRKNRCFDAGLVSFGAAWPTTIRLWSCCEKHFHSLDRSAVIGLITTLAVARLSRARICRSRPPSWLWTYKSQRLPFVMNCGVVNKRNYHTMLQLEVIDIGREKEDCAMVRGSCA